MPFVVKDLSGQRFSNLLVLRRGDSRSDHPSGQFHLRWLCLCDCGTQKEILGASLVSGLTRSCGCLHRYPEGQGTSHYLYRIWRSMLNRCNNPNGPAYRNYGGRGITVCDAWNGHGGFTAFLADMGDRPEGETPSGRPLYTLDRIDVDGNYEPSNCRWASKAEQNANQRPRVSLSTSLMNRIDDLRGDVSREAWIEQQLEACLAKGVLYD